jgi:hypothetical protein
MGIDRSRGKKPAQRRAESKSPSLMDRHSRSIDAECFQDEPLINALRGAKPKRDKCLAGAALRSHHGRLRLLPTFGHFHDGNGLCRKWLSQQSLDSRRDWKACRRRSMPSTLNCDSFRTWRRPCTEPEFCDQVLPGWKGGRGKQFILWWTWSGSNRRPLPCHGSALPAAPQAHVRNDVRGGLKQLNSRLPAIDSQTRWWRSASLVPCKFCESRET